MGPLIEFMKRGQVNCFLQIQSFPQISPLVEVARVMIVVIRMRIRMRMRMRIGFGGFSINVF
jgi:hypothetical protein